MSKFTLGIATAYGAAVRGGYTGTYDEWCALMADYATVGEQAQQAAQAIQDMGVEAETLAPGSGATVIKSINPQTGAVTLHFGIPRGEAGEQGPQGEAGADYVLTSADKTEIAQLVLAELPTAEGVSW